MEQANRLGNKNERKRMVFDFMIIQIKNRINYPSKMMEKDKKDELNDEVTRQLAKF